MRFTHIEAACQSDRGWPDGYQSDLTAVAYYRRAAELGDLDAKLSLALCYLDGKGVAKDTRHGVDLLMEAAQAGNTKSMSLLGEMLTKMTDNEPARRQGFEWLRRAAESEDVSAMESLVQCYKNGVGTGRDDALANSWSSKLAKVRLANPTR